MITLSANQFLLADLLISTAISAILTNVSEMSDEEVRNKIVIEQAKKSKLMEQVNAHGIGLEEK